jgi:hypothetical protein
LLLEEKTANMGRKALDGKEAVPWTGPLGSQGGGRGHARWVLGAR